MIHEGERAVQRRAGLTVDGRGSAGVNAAIPSVAAEFLSQQRMVVIGAADDAGEVWAGVLTGSPGFIAATGDRTIVAQALPAADDPLAGRFDAERDIGMLAIEPASRKRMRINGRARRDGDRLVIHTEQVYANCPKYIQTRTLIEDDVAPASRTALVTRKLTREQHRWITAADTFFIATHAVGFGTDTSHRGGNPGFVTATGGLRLTWPDYVGNSMYMTLGNLELDPHCGLVFLDWEGSHTLQLTGRARVDWDPDRTAAVPGAQRLVDFDVERVVQIAGASSQRWSFGEYFRFNPA